MFEKKLLVFNKTYQLSSVIVPSVFLRSTFVVLRLEKLAL
jgi:hypothetical protein